METGPEGRKEIAIVGIGARFGGDVAGVGGMWEALGGGKAMAGQLPRQEPRAVWAAEHCRQLAE